MPGEVLIIHTVHAKHNSPQVAGDQWLLRSPGGSAPARFYECRVANEYTLSGWTHEPVDSRTSSKNLSINFHTPCCSGAWRIGLAPVQDGGLGGGGPRLSFPCFLPDGRALAKLYDSKDRGEGMDQGIKQPEKAVDQAIWVPEMQNSKLFVKWNKTAADLWSSTLLHISKKH